jgi:transmembrane sensor
MSTHATIAKILWRYKQREELTEEELAELRLWLMESPENEQLFSDLSDTGKWDKEVSKWKEKDPEATWSRILKRVESISPEVFRKKRERGRYLIAASVLFILFSTGLYYRLSKKQTKVSPEVTEQAKAKDILPISGGAILTMSNGNAMTLDSLTAGMHTTDQGTEIKKTDSQALAYKTTGITGSEEKFNTLTTSKGNQFHLVLSDGTNVWLNATSSLRFPVSFTGPTRKVELTGEGYFEVTKNKEKPFIVDIGKSISVRVLGTHFNIKAYDDEATTKVTLMEGSVSVRNTKDSTIIKPDQTLQIDDHGNLKIETANAEQVMAWRNQIFWFKNASFEEVMRQLSRWYPMDVIYKGEVKDSYTGILPAKLPLSNVLHILEKGGNVHFTIDSGRKVTVEP